MFGSLGAGVVFRALSLLARAVATGLFLVKPSSSPKAGRRLLVWSLRFDYAVSQLGGCLGYKVLFFAIASYRGWSGRFSRLHGFSYLGGASRPGVAYASRLASMFGVGLLIAFFSIYIRLSLEVVPLAKIFFSWSSLFSIFYLLVSGFVFFLKRYSYGRFTSSVARF